MKWKAIIVMGLVVIMLATLMATPVSAEESVEICGKFYYLERGDLLFYYSITNHIGMYSGNGKFIDAHPENNLTDPGTIFTGFKTINAVNESEIEGSRFELDPDTQCYRVGTTQAKRDAAVEWAKGKIGENYNLWPRTPNCTGDEWYCSELVHCAYETQGIALGDPSDGWITPSKIINDSDVEPISPEYFSPAVVAKADQTTIEAGNKLKGERIIANPTDQTLHYKCLNEIRNSTKDLMKSWEINGYLDAQDNWRKKGYIYIPAWAPGDIYTYTAIIYDADTGDELDRASVDFTVIELAEAKSKNKNEEWIIRF